MGYFFPLLFSENKVLVIKILIASWRELLAPRQNGCGSFLSIFSLELRETMKELSAEWVPHGSPAQ